MHSVVYGDRSESPTGARQNSKMRPPQSAAIYITPPPQDERIPTMNVYRIVDSPMNSRPHSPCGFRSGSRTPTPCSSRPGSPGPHQGSKHNHSIQDLLKLIGKKVSGRKHKDTMSPASESRRTSCFLEVPKDTSQFRGRSKSLDDGAARKQTPSLDSAAAYKIYDEILREGMR